MKSWQAAAEILAVKEVEVEGGQKVAVSFKMGTCPRCHRLSGIYVVNVVSVLLITWLPEPSPWPRHAHRLHCGRCHWLKTATIPSLRRYHQHIGGSAESGRWPLKSVGGAASKSVSTVLAALVEPAFLNGLFTFLLLFFPSVN